ncbi:MAG: hypothetical protein V2B19_29605 [Pseudomonadota bacterium]
MPITGLPSIVVSSSEFILEKKTGDADSPSSFIKGQVINARVLEVVSGRQALLLIDGKRMLAKTFVPLKPGQEIKLQATGTGSQPVLRLVEGTPGGPSDGYHALIKSWGKAGPYAHLAEVLQKTGHTPLATGGKSMTAALSRLREWITEISLKSGDAAPRFLNDLIRGSGLLWEKKLLSLIATPGDLQAGPGWVEKDIKAMVMRLLSLDRGEQAGQLEGLRTFLDGLENLQLFNKFGDEESGRYLLPLPVMMQGDLKFGQLLLTLGDGRKKSEKDDAAVVKVSFLLTLTRLGDLRADFSVLGRVVSGAFGVATEEIKGVIEPRLIELSDRLLSHGYEVRDIGCRVVGEESLAGTALFDMAIQGARNGVLNVVI